MRHGHARALALLLAGTTCACSSSPARPAGSDTSTGDVQSSGEASGASSSSTTGPGLPGEDESTSIVWPPDDGITECVRTCEGPFDCCPASAAGSCPGAYPWNLDCVGGLCVPGRCESDADCQAAEPNAVCRPVHGLNVCVTLCDADPSVCAQPDTGLACSGSTDEGEGYCFESCDAPGVFCGNQTCDAASGRCVCRDGGQCLAGWVCV